MSKLELNFGNKKVEKMSLIESYSMYVSPKYGSISFEGLRDGSLYLYARYMNTSLRLIRIASVSFEDIEKSIHNIRYLKNKCKDILVNMTFSEVL